MNSRLSRVTNSAKLSRPANLCVCMYVLIGKGHLDQKDHIGATIEERATFISKCISLIVFNARGPGTGATVSCKRFQLLTSLHTKLCNLLRASPGSVKQSYWWSFWRPLYDAPTHYHQFSRLSWLNVNIWSNKKFGIVSHRYFYKRLTVPSWVVLHVCQNARLVRDTSLGAFPSSWNGEWKAKENQNDTFLSLTSLMMCADSVRCLWSLRLLHLVIILN